MTELSWLLDLLLNHKLSAKCKQHVAQRINEVEQKLSSQPIQWNQPHISQPRPQMVLDNKGVPQSPSTIAAMQRHESGTVAPPSIPIPMTEPVVPGIAAATVATAMAMNSRQQAIEAAISGKNEKGQSSPTKFRGPLR